MKNNTYLAIVKINGHEPDDYIMTGKSSSEVKRVLISFFKKTLGEDIEIEVQTARVELINGDYRKVTYDGK